MKGSEEKNEWCVKKEKEEEEVIRVSLGIQIKALGVEEIFLVQEEKSGSFYGCWTFITLLNLGPLFWQNIP